MAINNKLQNIIDTKTAIGAAIVNKGGTIINSTPFYSYISEIDNLSGGGVSFPGYENWISQDRNNFKYEVFNNYDAVTNPNPLNNKIKFNK